MNIELIRYIGDGVYARYEPTDASITLRTGSHKQEECDNTIFLESSVLMAFFTFCEKIQEVERDAAQEYAREHQENGQ